MPELPTGAGSLKPFHAQRLLCVSSSWIDWAPDFRQETWQSHYRIDPVKHDLTLATVKSLYIAKGTSKTFETFTK